VLAGFVRGVWDVWQMMFGSALLFLSDIEGMGLGGIATMREDRATLTGRTLRANAWSAVEPLWTEHHCPECR